MDAALIVRVGSFQIGDFGPDQSFEFARSCESAFDAVPHRSDLAADCLGKRDHLPGGDGFGLGQADRDFGHRARGEPHFLGAARHKRGHAHEHDRPEDSEKRESEFRPAI